MNDRKHPIVAEILSTFGCCWMMRAVSACAHTACICAYVVSVFVRVHKFVWRLSEIHSFVYQSQCALSLCATEKVHFIIPGFCCFLLIGRTGAGSTEDGSAGRSPLCKTNIKIVNCSRSMVGFLRLIHCLQCPFNHMRTLTISCLCFSAEA